MLNNWNNKPARGFAAADDQQAYGSIHRVDLLNRNTAKVKRHTPATLVGAMNAAATQDVRAMTFTPLLARVLRGGPAPSPRAQQLLDLLEAWTRNGGSRLDRDLDGKIDDPGAAVMDVAWDRLANAAMTPLLGRPARRPARRRSFMRRFDLPPGGQTGGWHMYMDKDLRTLLGDKVKGTFANRYCGLGDLAPLPHRPLGGARGRRRTILAATQGADPAAWRADATRERIKFAPGLLPHHDALHQPPQRRPAGARVHGPPKDRKTKRASKRCAEAKVPRRALREVAGARQRLRDRRAA